MSKKYGQKVYKDNNKIFIESLRVLREILLIESSRTELKTLFKEGFSVEKSFGNILTMLRKSKYPQKSTKDKDVLNELAMIDYHIVKTIRLLKEDLMTQSFLRVQTYVDELVELFVIRKEISKNSSDCFEEKKFFKENDYALNLLQKKLDKVEKDSKLSDELKEKKLLEINEKQEEFVQVRKNVCALLEKSFEDDANNKELAATQRKYGCFNFEKIKQLERKNLPKYYKTLDAKLRGYYATHNEMFNKFCVEQDRDEKVAERKDLSPRKKKSLLNKKYKAVRVLAKLIDKLFKRVKKVTPLKEVIISAKKETKAKVNVKNNVVEQQTVPTVSSDWLSAEVYQEQFESYQIDEQPEVDAEVVEAVKELLNVLQKVEEVKVAESEKAVDESMIEAVVVESVAEAISELQKAEVKVAPTTASSYFTPSTPTTTSSSIFSGAKSTTPTDVKYPVKQQPKQESQEQSNKSPFISHAVFRLLLITFVIFIMIKFSGLVEGITPVFVVMATIVGILGFSTKSRRKNKHLDIRITLLLIAGVVEGLSIVEGFWSFIISVYALGGLLDGIFGKKNRLKRKHYSMYILYCLLVFFVSRELSNWFMVIVSVIMFLLCYFYEKGEEVQNNETKQ